MPSGRSSERSDRRRFDATWNTGTPQQAVKLAESGPRCKRCGHTLWFHMGFREPGCVWLGECDCVEFVDPTA